MSFPASPLADVIAGSSEDGFEGLVLGYDGLELQGGLCSGGN
jgi:hypothetical protein